MGEYEIKDAPLLALMEERRVTQLAKYKTEAAFGEAHKKVVDALTQRKVEKLAVPEWLKVDLARVIRIGRFVVKGFQAEAVEVKAFTRDPQYRMAFPRPKDETAGATPTTEAENPKRRQRASKGPDAA